VTGVTSLVIGIGNRSRGDDAVGPEVASRVAQLRLAGVAVVVLHEPIALVEQFGAHDEVVVVDATDPRGHPGRVHVQQVGRAPLRRDPPALGSHGLGVADAVELARVLGRLPRRLTLVGVEARTFQLGAPLSTRVRESLGDAADAVVTALPATTCGAGSGARTHE
jgi:hydrogenase maturation protease